MLNCWEEEPSKRPTFSELRKGINQFMQDKCHLIHFASPDNGYDSLSEPYHRAASSVLSDFLVPGLANGVAFGYDSLARVPRSRSRSPSPQLDRLGVSPRSSSPRHHLSEPNLERRDGGSSDEEEEVSRRSGGFVRRSHSNPYVQTPKHSKSVVRRSVEFEWNFVPPQITIQPVYEGEEQ